MIFDEKGGAAGWRSQSCEISHSITRRRAEKKKGDENEKGSRETKREGDGSRRWKDGVRRRGWGEAERLKKVTH